MDPVLAQIVVDRLEADRARAPAVRDLVLAAFAGDDAVAAALEGEPVAPLVGVAPAEAEGPAGAYLRSVTVEGFRGVGPAARLDITPGPGLTLVVGRNGSGKSSLAEALEVLLTGDSRRWAGRSQVWREGWRNLHHPEATRIEGDFAEEGSAGGTTIRRVWTSADALEAGQVEVERASQSKEGMSALGWTAALDAFRPFLSYNELGSLLDEAPSKLYDAMAGILGLDDLVAAERRLGDERKAREKVAKDVPAALKLLLARLAEVDDDRARRSAAALEGRKPDLDRADAILLEAGPMSDGEDVGPLRSLASLASPDRLRASEIADGLRGAARRLAEMEGTDADRAGRTADLLSAALALHEAHGDGDCPVCGHAGALDATWREEAQGEVERLRRLALDAQAARDALASWQRAATDFRTPPPAALTAGAAVGVDTADVAQAWRDLEELVLDDPEQTANALEALGPRLAQAVEAVRDQAQIELERRQDAWRPMARELAAWLQSAREGEAAAEPVPVLKQAEKWLKDAAQDLRNQRFAPIAEEAARVWQLLRVQSNVDLGRVELSGSATQRRVVLAVTVDGAEGAALGVMSQGELHALALSLFLPRATLPESPFRFLVIDDPVQSMDPARIDGLARVLEEVAGRRQVVVLTHDDRLPESVRRLGIDATVVEVSRREGSVVELRAALDPVLRHLDDAYTLARADADLPAKIARQVVPGLCRGALEAACTETIRRRRLGRGERHADVDDLLAHVTSTAEWLALALYDDETRSGDVSGRLVEVGGRAAATLEACESGAHGDFEGDLLELVRDARALTERLRADHDSGVATLATVLFTDIVSSAERAAGLGDRRWRTLLDEHRRVVEKEVARQKGTIVKETGDGVLVTFESPGRAVRATRAIRSATGELGLQIRAGLHTGEIERRGDDITGVTVIIASRICTQAEPDAILVSRTITDLMVGSGLTFADRGAYELKGVPGTWPLFEVVDLTVR